MKLSIIENPVEFNQWCSYLRPIWSLDTETTSLSWLELEIIGFSISDGVQACYVNILPQYKEELIAILKKTIRCAKMIIFHNAAYDLMVLKKEGIEI